MRAALINTGAELLLGDVQDAHLAFIAREIFPLGLRIEERCTVPDTDAIRRTLAELLARCEILFVTGGLGPTGDDFTREMVADVLGLELRQDPELLSSLRRRLQLRRIKWAAGIARQADVPAGAQVLSNENGSAPGFYLKANINPRTPSPHLFVLPGPPRELQPMFRKFVTPILRSIVPSPALEKRIYKIAGIGESVVEEAIGEKVLAIPGIELGYCARPGEVEVRITKLNSRNREYFFANCLLNHRLPYSSDFVDALLQGRTWYNRPQDGCDKFAEHRLKLARRSWQNKNVRRRNAWIDVCLQIQPRC